jgi:tetratricopeptide (TPR) repeat protein
MSIDWAVAIRGCAALGLLASGCAHSAASRVTSGNQREQLLQRLQVEPTNVDAHLALARYDAAHGFPSSALHQYQTVQQASGLIGPRWNNSDVVRYRELLLQRAQIRIRNQRLGSMDDVARAKQLGARISLTDENQVKVQEFTAHVRHSDDRTRAAALRGLCTMSSAIALTGACATSPVAQQVQFAQWLWLSGANRASYEVLAALPISVAATAIENLKLSPRDRTSSSNAWLTVMQWWQGRVVPLQWQDIDACDALNVAAELFASQGSATGLLSLQKRTMLEIATPSLTARNVCRQELATLGQVPLVAVWTGEPQPDPATAEWRSPPPTLPTNTSSLGQDDLAGVFAKRWRLSPQTVGDLANATSEPGPATSETRMQQWVDRQLDGAEAAAVLAEWLYIHQQHAAAQRWWQRAVDSSPDPWYAQGLAVAAAANSDAPAAMLWAQRGAAAWGDPAAALLEVALALAAAKQHPEALTLLRQALALTSPALRASIELAINESLVALDRSPLFVDPLAVYVQPTLTAPNSQRDWQSRGALVALYRSQL